MTGAPEDPRKRADVVQNSPIAATLAGRGEIGDVVGRLLAGGVAADEASRSLAAAFESGAVAWDTPEVAPIKILLMATAAIGAREQASPIVVRIAELALQVSSTPDEVLEAVASVRSLTRTRAADILAHPGAGTATRRRLTTSFGSDQDVAAVLAHDPGVCADRMCRSLLLEHALEWPDDAVLIDGLIAILDHATGEAERHSLLMLLAQRSPIRALEWVAEGAADKTAWFSREIWALFVQHPDASVREKALLVLNGVPDSRTPSDASGGGSSGLLSMAGFQSTTPPPPLA